jgi:hypothetical protein
MAQVYFLCSNADGVSIDRAGTTVSGLAEAHDHAACIVRSLVAAPCVEDWRDWTLHVSDELGDEIFVVQFASLLGKPH